MIKHERCHFYFSPERMTFMINEISMLLQKDLGKTTTQTATAMTQLDPDRSWIIWRDICSPRRCKWALRWHQLPIR